MKFFVLSLVWCLVLCSAACSSRRTRLDLDVDVYLHPEAATQDDLLLREAVRKRLAQSQATHESTLHVQVLHGVVFLSGEVRSAAVRDEAVRIAESTEVAVNGQKLSAKGQVRNNIDVLP